MLSEHLQWQCASDRGTSFIHVLYVEWCLMKTDNPVPSSILEPFTPVQCQTQWFKGHIYVLVRVCIDLTIFTMFSLKLSGLRSHLLVRVRIDLTIFTMSFTPSPPLPFLSPPLPFPPPFPPSPHACIGPSSEQ